MHRQVDVPRSTKAAAQSGDRSFIIEPVDWNKRSERPLSAVRERCWHRRKAHIRPSPSMLRSQPTLPTYAARAKRDAGRTDPTRDKAAT